MNTFVFARILSSNTIHFQHFISGYLKCSHYLRVSWDEQPGRPGGKTSAPRVADLSSVPVFPVGIFPGPVIPVT